MSKFWSHPNHGWMISVPVSLILMALGCVIYNANNHELGFFDGFFILAGLALFIIGPVLIPVLFRRLNISDRIYERETGEKP